MNEVAASLAGPVAVGTGALTVAIVLLLGVIARGAPAPRTPSDEPPPAPDDASADARAAGSVRTRRWVGPVLGIAIGVFAAGPVGGVAGGAAALVLRHRRRVGQAAADRRRIEAGLPDAIELLVLCVHAGRSPTQAIGELAQRAPPAVRPGFTAVERQLHRGQGLAEALGELPAVLGPAARELSAVVATAEREGLPLAPMLDRLATDARAARRRQGDAAARRLPVQLAFPLVTCVLPSFVLLALAPAVLGALSTLRGEAP